MYTDLYTRLATNKALSTTGITNETDTIDLGVARDMGMGQDIYLVFTITTAFANAGTCYFQAGYSDSAAGTGMAPAGQTGNYTTADLPLGTQIVVRVNPITAGSTDLPGVKGRRYLLGRVVTGSATGTTAGAFTCDVVADIQAKAPAYASGFSFVSGA